MSWHVNIVRRYLNRMFLQLKKPEAKAAAIPKGKPTARNQTEVNNSARRNGAPASSPPAPPRKSLKTSSALPTAPLRTADTAVKSHSGATELIPVKVRPLSTSFFFEHVFSFRLLRTKLFRQLRIYL